MNILKPGKDSGDLEPGGIKGSSIWKILNDLIGALPYGTAILDENRRVLVSNSIYLESGHNMVMEEFFGHRPGESLSCLHARNGEIQCNFTGVCNYCRLPNAIIQSQKTENKEEQETTIQVPGESYSMMVDIRLTVQPLAISNRKLMLLTIMDISESKRKEILERVFFHDILNKTGSLSGIISYLNDNSNAGEREELLQLTGEVLQELNEEIIMQRQLLAAESGELVIQPVQVNCCELLTQSVTQISRLYGNNKIKIHNTEEKDERHLQTDPVLVKRILINMIKNALEASTEEQVVVTGIYTRKGAVRFWVHNKGLIPPKDQTRLFSRNFSTKGTTRGLGTYSMKLLGEEYLGGRVYFESHQGGTTFFLELPVPESS